MVPDKFNMVDMEGIDLIESQGVEVPGLYQKLVESIAQCRYQCLYNWKFDGILIPPTYVEMTTTDEEVSINGGVSVDLDDVIHIHSIEPPHPDPEIIPLLAEDNGVYNVPDGVDGFNPVTVNVPSQEPVINSITITENGTYTVSAGVDGFNPVIVNVPSDESVFTRIEPLYYDYIGGFISGNNWFDNDTAARTDIYAIETGKIYLINLGSVVGNRFRVLVLSTDPTEVTGQATGTSLFNADNPVPYQVVSPLFVSNLDGFLLVGKTNAYVNGIETYVSIFNPN